MKNQNTFFFNSSYVVLLISFAITAFVINDYWNRMILYLILIYSFIIILFLKRLSYRYSHFPILDLRIISALMITIYILIPLIGYAISDFQLNDLSDNRLRFQYKLKTEQLAIFHLNYYLPFYASFILSLLLLNRKSFIENKINFKYPNALLITTLIFIFIFETFFVVMSFIDNPPLIFKQLNNIFGSFRLVCYASLIFYIFLNWKNKIFQIIFILYLTYLTYGVFNDLMSRTTFFKTVLAIFFLFSIQVYRFNIFQLFGIGSILLLLAILVGGLNTNLSEYLTSIKLMGVASSEWWSSFGTAYQVHVLKQSDFYNYTTNMIQSVPGYIYFNDLFYLLPQQLVTKVDPSIWILDYMVALAGLSKYGIGFVWGALATVAIWDNYIFTVAYGILTAIIINFIHNFYVKKSDNFYIVIFYILACIYSYGIIRVGTGFFIYQLVYKTMPMIIILSILTSIVLISLSSGKKVS